MYLKAPVNISALLRAIHLRIYHYQDFFPQPSVLYSSQKQKRYYEMKNGHHNFTVWQNKTTEVIQLKRGYRGASRVTKIHSPTC